MLSKRRILYLKDYKSEWLISVWVSDPDIGFDVGSTYRLSSSETAHNLQYAAVSDWFLQGTYLQFRFCKWSNHKHVYI